MVAVIASPACGRKAPAILNTPLQRAMPNGSSWPALRRAFGRVIARVALHVEVPDFEGVLLDELTPRFDAVAHQDAENLFGGGRVFHGDLKE